MNIVVLGPQGSGKGTQAKLLVDKFGFNYFESGAYLRKIAEKNEEVRRLLNEGQLFPDEELTSYLTAYLDQESLYDDVVFDGFPRTRKQYEFLKNWLVRKQMKFDLVIVLKIREEETIRRLSARRQDPVSGKIYNLITEPPPSGVDPDKLVQRDDDKPDAIKRRLELYNEATVPLIEALKAETKVVELDGERSIEEIQKDIVGLVEK